MECAGLRPIPYKLFKFLDFAIENKEEELISTPTAGCNSSDFAPCTLVLKLVVKLVVKSTSCCYRLAIRL
jgi:hypothetical protein